MLYTLCFSLQNAVYFIMLTSLVPVFFKFYIQGVLKFKKNNSGAKGLIYGLQIEASLTVITKGREASGPIASRPIPGTPTAAAPVSQPPVSSDFPAGTALG